MTGFRFSTAEDLFEELARVDRALERAGEGLIIDPAQYEAHTARLRATRDQVLNRLAEIGGRAA